MSKDCSIVQDLLPLYAEDMLREETKEFVNGHLSQCAACRAELDALRADVKPQPVSAQPLRELKKQLQRKKLTAVLLAVTLALTLATTGFAYLTAPQYLAYHAADWSVCEPRASASADGGAYIAVNLLAAVSGTRVMSATDPDSGKTICFITAWRTPLDEWLASSGSANAVSFAREADGLQNELRTAESARTLFTFDAESCEAIYYSPNSGQEDVLLYGSRSGGVISLPRLALGYYTALSLALFIAFCIAFLICRKKKAGKPLGYLALAPASYLAGHLLVKGLTTTSYQMQRDFSLIAFAAVLIYSAVLLALSLLRQKREDHDRP